MLVFAKRHSNNEHYKKTKNNFYKKSTTFECCRKTCNMPNIDTKLMKVGISATDAGACKNMHRFLNQFNFSTHVQDTNHEI